MMLDLQAGPEIDIWSLATVVSAIHSVGQYLCQLRANGMKISSLAMNLPLYTYLFASSHNRIPEERIVFTGMTLGELPEEYLDIIKSRSELLTFMP